MIETKQVDRATYLGSHDVAAIMSDHPYKTKMAVYLEKIGQGSLFEPNEQTEWGLINEPAIIDKWADKKDILITEVDHNVFTRHKSLDFLGGHADGVTSNGLLGVDAKNIMFKDDKWGEEGTDEVPRYILWQAHHFLTIFPEAESWDVAALFTGCRHEIFTIQRDDQMVEAILEIAGEFWHKHVLENEPPDFDGSQATYQYLRKKFPSHSDQLRPATENELAKIRKMKEIEERIKSDKEIVEIVKQELQLAIGSDMGLTSLAGKITWKEQKGSTRIDSKMVKALYPEVFNECSKTGDPVRVFRKAYSKK